MPQPYSEDLRRRVLPAIEQQHMSLPEAADTFQVSLSFVEKLLRRWRATQSLAPQPHGGGRASPWAGLQQEVRAWVAEQPDRTLAELVALAATRQQVTRSVPAMSRLLQRLGLTRKKSRWWPANRTAPMDSRRARNSARKWRA